MAGKGEPIRGDATPEPPHVIPMQVKDANAGLPVEQIPDDVVEPALQPFEREIVQELPPP